MVRLLIADDHAVVRRGLRQILDETPDIEVGDEATNGFEVLEKVRTRKCDALVLDICLPDMSGLDVLKKVKAEFPWLPVLVLSMQAQEQYAARALKAGASGYLPKESAPEELVNAIRKICAGAKYTSDGLPENVITLPSVVRDQELHDQLSEREFEVLRQIASGKTLSQIATKMMLSVKTISTYRTRIIRKMGMKTNAELMRYGIRSKLVE
jgi:DNA-binding NarL/FixJ family response regulator